MFRYFRFAVLPLVVLPLVLASFLGPACHAQFGQQIATTVQLPTFGVAFDADGVLQVAMKQDPTGQLIRQRAAAARNALPGPIAVATKSRKVSLVRLEAAIDQRIKNGQSPTDAMLKLAGLNRIQAAYCFPDTGDVVLEGPAEGWMEDLHGRTVGTQSGRPTLLLEDCAVALRAYAPGGPKQDFVGCTINPRKDGLAALQKFNRSIPSVVSASQRQRVAQTTIDGIRRSLGMGNIKVFGIDSQTHFASVMIEADYRMKRMAIGVEPTPIRMTTFAQALTSGRNDGLQRWWFTPNYDGVMTTPDRLGVQLTGQGVQLQTEDKVVLSTGEIVDSGRKPSKAMRTYATGFTKNYERIAAADPIYAQLRQLCDWLIVAAFMRQQNWYEGSKWNAETLLAEDQFSVNALPTPKQAPAVVNAFWKAHRMFAPSGGVSMEVGHALERMEDSNSLAESRRRVELPKKPETWWWD